MLDFESQKVSLPVWALAALGSVAIHLGCTALGLEYLRDDNFDDALGAPAIEIGIELLALRLEPIELPPGPNIDRSIASPRIDEQNAIVEPTVLPPDVPTETPDPEQIIVAVETDKPKKDESEVPAPLAVPSVESVATEVTAPPTSEVIPISARSVTPAQGTGESPERVRATWQNELIAHFNRHKRYPANPSLQGAQVLVSFTLDETGHVLSSGIVQGAGDPSFDAAALAMIERSNPVPKPPFLVVQEGLSFNLPVFFRAKPVN
jgi:periplasmic protein TonB